MADEIDFYTDASGAAKLGFGCYYNKHWTYGMWEDSFISNCKPSIEFLELYVVAIAIQLWESYLQNKRVVVFFDNKSVVDMINNTVSSCEKCMKLIQNYHIYEFGPKCAIFC